MLSEQEKKELREMNSKMFAIQTSAYSNDCEECKRLKKRIEELEKDKDYLDERLQKQLEATLKLDKENEDLKKQLFTAKNERNAFKIYSDGAEADAINLNEQLSEAKEIIQTLSTCLEGHHTNSFEYEQIKQAEEFLKDNKQGE